MIKVSSKGDFSKTVKFLKKTAIGRRYYRSILEKYAREGVRLLSANTPTDTGRTANSWGYEITETASALTITFTNSNMNHGVNIAMLIQMGHATGTGGYVQGRDFINPVIQPLFDELADKLWKEVTVDG